jgi:hypothetical protein
MKNSVIMALTVAQLEANRKHLLLPTIEPDRKRELTPADAGGDAVTEKTL